MAILEGSVVYIDDEWEDGSLEAGRFYQQLRDDGRPMCAYTDIPPEGHLGHWDGLAMVILDWNLTGSQASVPGGETLRDEARERMLRFLATLLERYFCPVFIVSSTDPDKIIEELLTSEAFAGSELDTRIRVIRKSDVGETLLATLEAKVESDPVLMVLRVWEQQYQRAKNRMFIDFNGMGRNWPAYIVRAANADGVDPGHELVETIYANLRHRVDPLVFDDAKVAELEGNADSRTLQSVSQGRTILLDARLPKHMVFPGDIFRLGTSDPDEVWINISPICQTVSRPARGDGAVQEGEPKPIRLHLIRGRREPFPPSNNKHADLMKKGHGPNGIVIHTMLDGFPYYFDFGDASIRPWDEVKEHRVGRVLPPYITRLQQMHAAYLQSEGLPRVEFEVYHQVPQPPS